MPGSVAFLSGQSRDPAGGPCPASTLWTAAPLPCPPPRPGGSTPSLPLCLLAGPEHCVLGASGGLGFPRGIKRATGQVGGELFALKLPPTGGWPVIGAPVRSGPCTPVLQESTPPSGTPRLWLLPSTAEPRGASVLPAGHRKPLAPPRLHPRPRPGRLATSSRAAGRQRAPLRLAALLHPRPRPPKPAPHRGLGSVGRPWGPTQAPLASWELSFHVGGGPLPVARANTGGRGTGRPAGRHARSRLGRPFWSRVLAGTGPRDAPGRAP